MDPVSLSAAAVAFIGAGIASAKTLRDAVKAYRSSDKTLARLLSDLQDLIDVLSALQSVANDKDPILKLLERPVQRCSKVCDEFEVAMRRFDETSNTKYKSWKRMQFMSGDMTDFIDNLGDYKSTISIAIGTINMRNAKVSQEFASKYLQIIQATIDSLETRLNSLDEKLQPINTESSLLDAPALDLRDEVAVTVQCLRICERASSYLEALQHNQPILNKEAPQKEAAHVLEQFEAQILTIQKITDAREGLTEALGRLRARLDSMASNEGSFGESEKLQLQEEIKSSHQCLEVCKKASELTSQKILIMGDVTADAKSGQVVVNTWADLWKIGNVKVIDYSAQVVGAMKDETLQSVFKDLCESRFGAVNDASVSMSPPPRTESQKSEDFPRNSTQVKGAGQPAGPVPTSDRPSPNEVRRRKTLDEDEPKKTH